MFGGSLFGSSNTPAPEIAAQSQPAPQPPLARITVAPIIGAPDAIAKQIQQEFTSAVEKQRVSVTTGKDERADYTLRGYIVAAKDKSATKVSYIWDVTDPTGKRVNRITGEEVVTDGQLRLTAGARVATGTRGEGSGGAGDGRSGEGGGRRGGGGRGGNRENQS